MWSVFNIHKGTRVWKPHGTPKNKILLLLLVLSQSWPELASGSFGRVARKLAIFGCKPKAVSCGRVNFRDYALVCYIVGILNSGFKSNFGDMS